MVNESEREIFSSNLKYLMKKNGLTRKEFCEDANIKYTTLAGWLEMSRFPREEALEKLRDYFRLEDACDLLEYDMSKIPDGYYPYFADKFMNLLRFNTIEGSNDNTIRIVNFETEEISGDIPEEKYDEMFDEILSFGSYKIEKLIQSYSRTTNDGGDEHGDDPKAK